MQSEISSSFLCSHLNQTRSNFCNKLKHQKPGSQWSQVYTHSQYVVHRCLYNFLVIKASAWSGELCTFEQFILIIMDHTTNITDLTNFVHILCVMMLNNALGKFGNSLLSYHRYGWCHERGALQCKIGWLNNVHTPIHPHTQTH